MLTDGAAGLAFADHLAERNDTRGECVRLLVAAPVLIPPCPPPRYYDVMVVATDQWTPCEPGTAPGGESIGDGHVPGLP